MSILLCGDIKAEHLDTLLEKFGIVVKHVGNDEELPGSFWKDREAGLISNVLYISDDTPVHSALHEACHYICMDQQRRSELHTNAGGNYEEEDAVCYLQTLLADMIPEMGRERSFSDMDEWGYSFRLGSAKAWFERDAEDALDWLTKHKLLDKDQQPAFSVRK